MDSLNPLISIIVPVYKVEPYLRKCVDSILAQTYINLEVILIDDGSPDGCSVICDEYKKIDSRVIVIHQKNSGVSTARNAGLDSARGDYIGFIDSDDWIAPDMYEKMLSIAENKKCDIVSCGITFYKEDYKKSHDALTTDGEYTREQLLEEIFGMPNQIGGGIWNKLFRREVIYPIRFDKEVAIGEDWIFLFEVARKCSMSIKLSEALYCVYERPGSATRNENALIFGKQLLGSSLLLLLCREKEPWLEGKAVNKYLDDCVRYIPLIRKCGRETQQKYHWSIVQIKWKMLKTMARAWWKKMLPSSILIRYIYLCLIVNDISYFSLNLA